MMRRLGRPLVAAFILAAALSGNASAAAPSVALSLSGVALVRQSDGSYKEAPVADVVLKAGDRVRYTILATNKGDAPALHLTPNDPIPARMEYVVKSASTTFGSPEYTVDGKTWSPRPTVVVKTAAGPVTKPAPASEYRAIRWVMTTPLEPKASAKFAFEVRVK